MWVEYPSAKLLTHLKQWESYTRLQLLVTFSQKKSYTTCKEKGQGGDTEEEPQSQTWPRLERCKKYTEGTLDYRREQVVSLVPRTTQSSLRLKIFETHRQNLQKYGQFHKNAWGRAMSQSSPKNVEKIPYLLPNSLQTKDGFLWDYQYRFTEDRIRREWV